MVEALYKTCRKVWTLTQGGGWGGLDPQSPSHLTQLQCPLEHALSQLQIHVLEGILTFSSLAL